MNYKLNLSYDGAKYKGWQRQRSTPNTIQGKIEETLSKYLNKKIKITAASRTDAGAHALMQVINFDIDDGIDVNKLKQEINQYLPEDIVVRSVMRVDDRFHSRYNAKKKTYIYKIWKKDASVLPLFERKYVYLFNVPIDVASMQKASKKFIGEHDFKGFSSDKTKKGTIRKIEKIDIKEDENMITIQVTGDGFLYNMVRIMVGTLLEIVSDQRQADTIDEVFASKDREKAGFTAPAHGLFLQEIFY